jgi:hypothetical protein
MSEETTKEQQVNAVPTEAVVAYLSDLYRQLDALSFNIRTNINNIMPRVDGEVTNASTDQS